MKAFIIAIAIVSLAMLCGCRAGTVSDEDARNLTKEFSDENYEKNMRAAGKGAEYEAEKKRQQEQYQQGGG